MKKLFIIIVSVFVIVFICGCGTTREYITAEGDRLVFTCNPGGELSIGRTDILDKVAIGEIESKVNEDSCVESNDAFVQALIIVSEKICSAGTKPVYNEGRGEVCEPVFFEKRSEHCGCELPARCQDSCAVCGCHHILDVCVDCKSCNNIRCGCDQYNLCRHSAHGKELNGRCRHPQFGFSHCEKI